MACSRSSLRLSSRGLGRLSLAIGTGPWAGGATDRTVVPANAGWTTATPRPATVSPNRPTRTLRTVKPPGLGRPAPHGVGGAGRSRALVGAAAGARDVMD